MALSFLAHRAALLRPHGGQRTRALCKMSAAAAALAGADPEQARLMSEQVILVDRNDAITGALSKGDAHLVSNDLPLHRAFSLFLFNGSGEMLLQKRAATKLTFPSHWTNAVCSHPLHIPTETGEGAGDNATRGAARAAVRKISHELGVRPGDIAPEELKFLTRVHYRAESDGDVWGEHELDYVFFAQKDLHTEIVENEVEEIRYVDRDQLKELYALAAKGDVKITPWFRHIVDNFGWTYWDTLLDKGMGGLDEHVDKDTIHRMGVTKDAK